MARSAIGRVFRLERSLQFRCRLIGNGLFAPEHPLPTAQTSVWFPRPLRGGTPGTCAQLRVGHHDAPTRCPASSCGATLLRATASLARDGIRMPC